MEQNKKDEAENRPVIDVNCTDDAFRKLLGAVMYHIGVEKERGLAFADAHDSAAAFVIARLQAYSAKGAKGGFSLWEIGDFTPDFTNGELEYFALGLTMGALFQRNGWTIKRKATERELN